MTLHRIGEARGALHAAIAGVLDPGRVSAYPSGQDVGTAVWIGKHEMFLRGNTIDVQFPVHCTADGTGQAQEAAIDDLVSRVWDACERLKNTQPERSTVAADIQVGSSFRRQQIVTVSSGIAARTLCLPDAPGVSPIPPDMTQE